MRNRNYIYLCVLLDGKDYGYDYEYEYEYEYERRQAEKTKKSGEVKHVSMQIKKKRKM